MNAEHKRLHEALDSLLAYFLGSNPGKRPSDTTILELMDWSFAKLHEHEPQHPERQCNHHHEQRHASRPQHCREQATHVCRTPEGLEWFACEAHKQSPSVPGFDAPTSATPIAEWFARHGLGRIHCCDCGSNEHVRLNCPKNTSGGT